MLNRKTTLGKDLQAKKSPYQEITDIKTQRGFTLKQQYRKYKENSASVFILNYLFYSYFVTNCPRQKCF